MLCKYLFPVCPQRNGKWQILGFHCDICNDTIIQTKNEEHLYSLSSHIVMFPYLSAYR